MPLLRHGFAIVVGAEQNERDLRHPRGVAPEGDYVGRGVGHEEELVLRLGRLEFREILGEGGLLRRAEVGPEVRRRRLDLGDDALAGDRPLVDVETGSPHRFERGVERLHREEAGEVLLGHQRRDEAQVVARVADDPLDPGQVVEPLPHLAVRIRDGVIREERPQAVSALPDRRQMRPLIDRPLHVAPHANRPPVVSSARRP
jgi:hypothetical protein